MQSRIFTKNRPLKVFKIRRIEWLFRTSVGILLARGRAFPFGVSVIPPRAPPPRTPHLHISPTRCRAPARAYVGLRAVLPPSGAPRARPRRACRRARAPPLSVRRWRLNVVFVGAECAPFSKTGGSETSWPRCPRCVRDFPVSNRIDTRLRADARGRRAPSRPNDKSANSAGVPDSQHEERRVGRRVEIARFTRAPPPPPSRSSRRSSPIRTHTNAFIRDSLPLNPRRHSCSAGTG